MTADRDDLAAIGQQIITDYALDHESLHANWRCEHPDVYGPCGCVDEFLTSFASMVLESDWLRDAKADVWDAGFNDGAHYASADMSHATYRTPPPPNPHRLERTAACRYDQAEDYCDSCDPPYRSCPYRADRVDAEDTDNTTDRTYKIPD